MISVGSGAMGVCSSCLVPAPGWHRSGDYWQDMRELGRGSDGREGSGLVGVYVTDVLAGRGLTDFRK